MNGFIGAPIGPERRGTQGRRLWLVRHGESSWNATGLVQGQLDPGLTPHGRAQAARCAETLAAGPGPEVLYSSDLRRALETAAAIGSRLSLDVHIDPRLRERSLGDAEGRPSDLLGADRSGVVDGRVVDADAAPAGGESIRQLYERATSCAATILDAHAGDVVLVCHGGVVRVLLAWLDGVEPGQMPWPDVDNALPLLRDTPVPSVA